MCTHMCTRKRSAAVGIYRSLLEHNLLINNTLNRNIERRQIPQELHLLANTKTRKNSAQQIIAAELTGDLGERVLYLQQFFSEQFTSLAFLQHEATGLEVGLCPLQGIEMALTGNHGALTRVAETGKRLDRLPEVIESGASQG